MVIDRTISTKKPQLLTYFRNRGQESLEEISRNYSSNQYKQKASEVNKAIIETKSKLLLTISQKAIDENWTRIDLLNSVLMITYCSYISMIDLRNAVWEYDYMAFSRRIGELWEPFCKICFEYSLKKIELFIPPLFSDVKRMMTDEIGTYIDKLTISNSEKRELKKYYDKVWGMVTSGEIKLELDLHLFKIISFIILILKVDLVLMKKEILIDYYL